MNGVVPLPKPIPQRILKFLGEWLSSTAELFIDPANALRVYTRPQQIASAVKRDVAFSGSCLFVSSLIYLLVILRIGVSWGDYAREITPISILILVYWIIYSLIIGAVIKQLGGIVDSRLNVSFAVRALATFYLVSVVMATIGFLAAADRKDIFDIMTQILRVVLPLVIMPMVFWKPNNLKGLGIGILYFTIFVLAVGNAALDRFMSSDERSTQIPISEEHQLPMVMPGPSRHSPFMPLAPKQY